jgi:hypothetical protein
MTVVARRARHRVDDAGCLKPRGDARRLSTHRSFQAGCRRICETASPARRDAKELKTQEEVHLPPQITPLTSPSRVDHLVNSGIGAEALAQGNSEETDHAPDHPCHPNLGS